MGCHGYGAISHSSNRDFSLGQKFRIKFVQVNDMVPMKHCPRGGVQDRSNYVVADLALI